MEFVSLLRVIRTILVRGGRKGNGQPGNWFKHNGWTVQEIREEISLFLWNSAEIAPVSKETIRKELARLVKCGRVEGFYREGFGRVKFFVWNRTNEERYNLIMEGIP